MSNGDRSPRLGSDVTSARYQVRYAVRGSGPRVWNDVIALFDDVLAATGTAASIESNGMTTQIIDIVHPGRRDLYPRHGSCSNANHGKYGHECGKPAAWLGTARDGHQSGRCEKCRVDGDERFGLEFVRLAIQPASTLISVRP